MPKISLPDGNAEVGENQSGFEPAKKTDNKKSTNRATDANFEKECETRNRSSYSKRSRHTKMRKIAFSRKAKPQKNAKKQN